MAKEKKDVVCPFLYAAGKAAEFVVEAKNIEASFELEASRCMEDECALWDEDNQICGLRRVEAEAT